LFVFDFKNSDMQVPEYDESQVVSANESAISIRVISETDGAVTVHLERSLPDVVLRRTKEVFRGLVSTPGGRISVVTSQNEQLLELDVASPTTSLLVAVR
jgi:hypothetical protein